MREGPGLASVQEGFLAGVLAGRETAPEPLLPFLRTPPTGSLDERWHIYAHGFLARLVESIENDYPALAKVLGSGPFGSLTARYARRFPPRSHDIGRFGDRLAGFLEDDPLTDELPFLPDLGRLEWAVAEAVVAPDQPSLSWDHLARLGPEAATGRPLALRPGAALVRSAWPIHEIWSCRGAAVEAIDVPLTRSARAVLVSRRGLHVVCRPAAEPEVLLFQAAERRQRVRDVADEGGMPAGELVAAFRALVDDGVFAGPRTGRPRPEADSTRGPRGG